MPQAIAASGAAHNPPFEVWPHKKARLRARAPGPHRWRREIATAICTHDPMRSAAGALHAHLREVSGLCCGKRGATVARDICASFAARLASHSIGDFRGPLQDLLADHGISASDRTALAGVRLLASLSSLVEVDPRSGRVRLRLSEQFHRAVAAARRARIDARWFAPVAVVHPSYTGSFAGFEHRTAEKPATSESASVIDARVRGESVFSRTHSELLRELSAGRWVQLAARLLREHPGLCCGPVCSAMSRRLLEVGGVSHGYREVEGLLRGLRYLLREGFLRADSSGSLGLDCARHPDLVILGIDVPADARACSKDGARYLRGLGVVAPEALGRLEATALMRRLWWRRHKHPERLTLPEMRRDLDLPVCPQDFEAYMLLVDADARSFAWGFRSAQAQHATREEFSRRLSSQRHRSTMTVWPEEPDDDIRPGTESTWAAPECPDREWSWAHYEADGSGPDGDDADTTIDALPPARCAVIAGPVASDPCQPSRSSAARSGPLRVFPSRSTTHVASAA